MDYLSFACRCLIALVFVASAVGKTRARAAFDEFTRTTRVLLVAALSARAIGRPAVRFVAIVVVAAEAAVPVLLVVPATVRLGFGLGMVLLLGFGVGIAAAIAKGIRTSCRCFGASSTPLGAGHLVRNAALFVAAGAGLMIGPGSLGRADPAGLALAGAAAVVLAFLVVQADDLIDLFTRPSAESGRTSR